MLSIRLQAALGGTAVVVIEGQLSPARAASPAPSGAALASGRPRRPGAVGKLLRPAAFRVGAAWVAHAGATSQSGINRAASAAAAGNLRRVPTASVSRGDFSTSSTIRETAELDPVRIADGQSLKSRL